MAVDDCVITGQVLRFGHRTFPRQISEGFGNGSEQRDHQPLSAMAPRAEPRHVYDTRRRGRPHRGPRIPRHAHQEPARLPAASRHQRRNTGSSRTGRHVHRSRRRSCRPRILAGESRPNARRQPSEPSRWRCRHSPGVPSGSTLRTEARSRAPCIGSNRARQAVSLPMRRW